MVWEGVTPEWCEANGFKRSELGFYERLLSEGPGDSAVSLIVGNYPFNAGAVTLNVDGYGVVTSANTIPDILKLIALFDGAPIDHPDEAWLEGDESDKEE